MSLSNTELINCFGFSSDAVKVTKSNAVSLVYFLSLTKITDLKLLDPLECLFIELNAGFTIDNNLFVLLN